MWNVCGMTLTYLTKAPQICCVALSTSDKPVVDKTAPSPYRSWFIPVPFSVFLPDSGVVIACPICPDPDVDRFVENESNPSIDLLIAYVLSRGAERETQLLKDENTGLHSRFGGCIRGWGVYGGFPDGGGVIHETSRHNFLRCPETSQVFGISFMIKIHRRNL